MDPMAAIRDTFFQECEEQLSELERGLMRMESGETDQETVNAVFRAVHSVKGGAGAFGLEDLVRFAHVFETALDQVRAGKLDASANAVRLLLRASDALADLVRCARDGATPDEAQTTSLAAALKALTSGGTTDDGDAGDDEDDGLGDLTFLPLPVAVEAEAAPPAGWIIKFRPLADLYANANEAALLLREVSALGPVSVTVDTSSLPDFAELDPEGAYLTWTIMIQADCDEQAIRSAFEFVEDDCELVISRASDQADEASLPQLGVDEDGAGNVETIHAPAPVMAASETTSSGIPSDADVLAMIRKAQQSVSPSEHDQPQAAGAGGAQHPSPPTGRSRQDAAPAMDGTSAKSDAGSAVGATIRVDLDRVDRLIDLVGELVINEAMLTQRVMEAGLARASGVAAALDELEHLTREIQDSVMAIRAQPVRSVFQRMPRLVREVAAMTGKQVRLLTDGEGTEVDKTVIERIADPLTHMIRNAIDHGLEPTDARLAAGKPEEGVVKLTALHRSGRIVIEVADDGAGINRERVKAKAVEKGLIAPEAQLSDEETDNLIFLPGFSTASTVSDISGRGVGMDVVRRSVQSLGGRISIASRPGAGSTFTLSLPLTLAVLDGMVVSVAGHTLIVPLSAIIETLQPQAANVHTLGTDVRVVAMRGRYIPLVDVSMALGYRDAPLEADKSVALLVEGEGGIRAVLIVDAIQGQRQVVIKSLEANYRAVPGIAAATVMGDGRVALILDVDAIVSVTRTEILRGDALRAEPFLLQAS
ncbi:MAG: chemotaxis protein CheA [Acidiphilium sp. 37-64-53]|uniref:chemotaxis protein CheA n=1 Tax=Acidiphilium TaxID=522 RepID=UPI000BD5F308|nr:MULTISPECIES: chemotaxis protein CheA [Acidiphilium]OYV63627.1 MAG: chemotaxis protein CheA [Acidiphilium sp. 21-62-4]OYW02120.1 MAG: chemotaxis protein CheA [Acidiphilium sp. 37-64-53]OZB25197.1 MAG: chemotaxis protein CheA [Acidiphilium sp. 34-64-41]HQT84091.1 chemotaxis protein CheA [Acidiphilium rubrum]